MMDWKCWTGLLMFVVPLIGIVAAVIWSGLKCAVSTVRELLRADSRSRLSLLKERAFDGGMVVLVLGSFIGYMLLSTYLMSGCDAPPIIANSGAQRIVVRLDGEPATCDIRLDDVVIDPGGFAELRIEDPVYVISCEVAP